MTANPITPERLAEIEQPPFLHAVQGVAQSEWRELLRVYRSHLAQAEPDRSGEPAIVAQLRRQLVTFPVSLDAVGGCWTREAAQALLAHFDRPAAAELEAQLANEQRAHKAYREEAQRIDKARDEQLATVTTERDQAWENRNMLRRELDAVTSLSRAALRMDLQAEDADKYDAFACVRMVQQELRAKRKELSASRAEVLRLNELKNKEELAYESALDRKHAKLVEVADKLRAERAKSDSMTKVIARAEAWLTGGIDSSRVIRDQEGHAQAWQHLHIEASNARHLLRELQPAAPKEEPCKLCGDKIDPADMDVVQTLDEQASAPGCESVGMPSPHWLRLSTYLHAHQACSPTPAKEFTTVSVPAVPTDAEDEATECPHGDHCCQSEPCSGPQRPCPMCDDGVRTDGSECKLCDGEGSVLDIAYINSLARPLRVVKEQATSEHDAEQAKRLEDMGATLAGSVSLGAFGSILLQYLRAERKEKR